MVKDNRLPFTEHLVPISRVEETAPDLIKLNCYRDELSKMGLFVYQEFLRVILPDFKKWVPSYVICHTLFQQTNTILNTIGIYQQNARMTRRVNSLYVGAPGWKLRMGILAGLRS